MADTAKQREEKVRERKARPKRKVEEPTNNPVKPVPVVGAVEGIAEVPEEANPVGKSAAAEAPQEGRVELEEEASEAGNLGAKTGRGFYDWTQRDADAYRADAQKRLAALLEYLAAT